MSTELVPNEFSILLKGFNELAEGMPPIEKVKSGLLELKNAAKNSMELTYRQKDAIVARVDNYLAGTYGNTKKAEHLKHSGLAL